MGVQALFTSASASNVPFLVVVDLPFGDAGVLSSGRLKLSRRVVASKDGGSGRCWAGRERRKRIRLVSNSWICRANSFDDQAAGYPESDDEYPKLEAGTPRRDVFRSAPPPELVDDEFFSRMNIALEASRRSSSGAASTSIESFFEGSSLHAACEPPRPSPGGHGVAESPNLIVTTSCSPPKQALCALQNGAGVQLPSSIKKLRRRKGDLAAVQSARESAGCAIRRAFTSMVYMIKAVQSHALQIRQVMFAETWDVQEVLHLVHKEMHSSFVWLFQRVFACTPKLMVSVMILLANFTVFSMGENLSVTDTPPAISHFLIEYGNPQTVSSPELPKSMSMLEFSGESMAALPSAGSGGNFRFPGALIAEGFDDDSWLTGAMKEHVQLAREITTRKLVAPHLESDNYGCFDSTDLDYQLAIAKDPMSPVLLANYAQFLFVVRRDHNRAEEYFHRAMETDPRDSTILDRFASFLWLGRGDRCAAERVYKAAMAADPESSYSAGSYAHFLWHAGDGDANHGHMA